MTDEFLTTAGKHVDYRNLHHRISIAVWGALFIPRV